MSPRDLALDALDYIGIGTLAAASARQKAHIARDITASLQKIYAMAPAVYKRRDGAIIAGPTTIFVTVVKNSTSLTTSDTVIDGATIKIGSSPYNEIRADGSTKYLRIPFTGESGSYSAVMYGDSVLLDSTVERVIGSVKLEERFDLTKRDNREDATTQFLPEPDYGRRIRSSPSSLSVGQPASYWVESVYSAGTNAQNRTYIRMKLYPLPNAASSVAFDVRVKAPRLVVADLGDDTTDSTTTLPIAADMIESTLLPIFLEKWTKSPWFKDDKKEKSIKDDAEEARGLLRQYRPQQPSNRRMTAPL